MNKGYRWYRSVVGNRHLSISMDRPVEQDGVRESYEKYCRERGSGEPARRAVTPFVGGGGAPTPDPLSTGGMISSENRIEQR